MILQILYYAMNTKVNVRVQYVLATGIRLSKIADKKDFPKSAGKAIEK